ncbi:MAG: aminotransferase class IV, partial [Melioribacteraceae bacterium]|nr:aminotransferase class IV [Melioribacteraceae bacterium]
PPVSSGLLNGCYRGYLITKKNVIEKSFGIDELLDADRIIIINSVRGEITISEIMYNGNLTTKY